MDPRKVAAHFVAFVFYLNRDGAEPIDPADAGRFARRNWPAFLSYADVGLGRLLTRITPPRAVRTARFSEIRPSERKCRIHRFATLN